jgi:hypothetical protein
MNERPNRILEFLTAPAQPDGDACRSNRRRRSSVRVELSWAEGPNWRTIPARLRDISKGGACLVALKAPPLTRCARLRFVEGEGSPWIEGEILGVDSDERKRQRIRMRFESPCPSFLLRLAVLDTAESNDEMPAARYEWVAWRPGIDDQGGFR